jgi:hypothetical protein
MKRRYWLLTIVADSWAEAVSSARGQGFKPYGADPVLDRAYVVAVKAKLPWKEERKLKEWLAQTPRGDLKDEDYPVGALLAAEAMTDDTSNGVVEGSFGTGGD